MTELTEYKTIDTAIPVPVYPDEFTLILRAINYALDHANLSTEEEERLQRFQDDFADLALEHSV